jgi:hypothetical protein
LAPNLESWAMAQMVGLHYMKYVASVVHGLNR